MRQDIAYALRQILRQPGFTAVVVLALALGIGANTAVFSVVDAVLLKSLPVKDPAELVLFEWTFKANPKIGYLTGEWTHDAGSNQVRAASFSRPAFERFRGSTTLEHVFACDRLGARNAVIDGETERLETQAVSGEYFSGLGLSAARGRTIAGHDEEAAVISHGYWQRRFGGRDDAVGKTGTIDGQAFTVVGVAPHGFAGTMSIGTPPDMFLPLSMSAHLGRGTSNPNSHSLQVMARVKPDVPLARAEAEMGARLAESLPDAAVYQPQLRLAPGRQGLTKYRTALRDPLLMLSAITGLVLLMACASVAGLQLARAAVRQQEIAVRLALGGSRWSLVRQLLVESAVLSLLGGAAGLAVARWTKDILAAGVMTDGAPSIALDARVLAFTAALSLATGLLFGLVPALRATSGRDVALRPSRAPLTPDRTLVIAQMGLSFVLLVGAGLMLRTLANLGRVDSGFDGRTVHVFKVQAPDAEARANDLPARVMERLRAEPGLSAVGTSDHDLVAGNTDRTPVSIEGVASAGGAPRYGYVNHIGGDFFGATGIPIRAGRAAAAADAGSNVMVVNEAFVRAHLRGRDPLGVKVNDSRIVGVAGDTKYGGLREPSPPTMFLPAAPRRGGMFCVRSDRPASEVAALVRRAVHAVSPTLVAHGFTTAVEQIEDTVRRERFLAALTTVSGALALLLAAVGLYGLVAYAVSRRTREIGVRMALGASAADVLRHTIGDGLRLVLAGTVLGALGAIALGRLLASVLYGVDATDLVTFAAAWLALTVAALLACWLPARRAARIDPAQALRYE